MSASSPSNMSILRIFNTLSRSLYTLKQKDQNTPVTMYACGPTVYDHTHIGHMRKYVMDDVLKRVLIFNGFAVQHVMNITDVGHLTGDDDTGEDKLETGAAKQGKSVFDIAHAFEEEFLSTMKWIGVMPPNIVARATEHVADMIALITRLEEKGVVYDTPEAVYFDTTLFTQYGRLSGQNLDDKKAGARDKVVVSSCKKHPADFALWFKRVGRFATHTMHWESPWGDGFPGWHIECSAMSMKYLGETIDIHTGGIDHIPVHHENEIAQSESATGKEFVRCWVHHAHLMVDGEKMSKSKGNFYTKTDIETHGYDAMALRYLFLQTHYQKSLNFTWESLEAASQALKSMRMWCQVLTLESAKSAESEENPKYIDSFLSAINDNLNFPKALALLWMVIRDKKLTAAHKLHFLNSWDEVFGLGISAGVQAKWRTCDGFKILLYQVHHDEEKLVDLVTKRRMAKLNKNFTGADELRKEITNLGFVIEDTSFGYIINGFE